MILKEFGFKNFVRPNDLIDHLLRITIDVNASDAQRDSHPKIDSKNFILSLIIST